MRSLLSLILLILLIGGCGTTAEQQAQQKFAPNLGPDVIKALQDIKAILQPLLGTIVNDAAATRAWADKVLGPNGTSPDPVKYTLAYACPTATDAVGHLITGTIDDLIAQVTAMSNPVDSNAPQGLLMLYLTQLKYGPQSDPQTQLAGLKAKLEVQVDALFTGCIHLFPKKQMNDVINLMVKAGVIGYSGGTLAPIMGVLP